MQILDHNIISHVRYSYDIENSCADSGCEQEGICRCSVITAMSITEIKFHSLVDDIYELYFAKGKSTTRNSIINSVLYDITVDLQKYTIDRILRHYKIWNLSNLNVEIVDGYYGQEVDRITIREDIALKIEENLDKALSIMNFGERMEYLLILEYGHLLTELKNKKWSTIDVSINDINFGSKTHKSKVNNLDLSHYTDVQYKLFRGICLKSENTYRLIDGYHRCSATENKTVKIIVVE